MCGYLLKTRDRAMSRTKLTRGAGNRRHLDNSLKEMANFVPVLDVETKIQRKLFAEKYLDLEDDSFWSTAVFSDEQRFTCNDAGVAVGETNGEKILVKLVLYLSTRSDNART
ncbi:hypothetical protein DAPPUDRAFT_321929 [Daphnia pulex]|uniref:Uncharacterized protein n=1 Tax=Daphnia pulex TaxID=6669 RepID=E9GUL0_DAPPU|nr:hypothetical protein DAPPUDRAFT_321929 [Daphnia pulex]|eukprot:EFX76746.1 hypothetical protein DAPPUDRAFT_321929 [Daphnia pulex]